MAKQQPWTTRIGLPELWQMLGSEEMKIEEFRADGDLVVRVELPGIDPDKDVEVSVSEGTLTIHAERTRETKEETESHFRSEFRYGSFTRRIPLPAGANEDDVRASYTDGILEVRVPIVEGAATARKVPISRS